MKFLNISIRYPHLDFGPWPYLTELPLTPRQAYQRNQLGWILITVFERAYLLQSSMGRARWGAWVNFIKDYCTSPTFRYIWAWDNTGSNSHNNQVDVDFEAFMNNLLEQVKPIPLKPYPYLPPTAPPGEGDGLQQRPHLSPDNA